MSWIDEVHDAGKNLDKFAHVLRVLTAVLVLGTVMLLGLLSPAIFTKLPF